MTRLEARKKLLQSIGACFLAFVMILTNVLGAVEVYAANPKLRTPTINPVSPGATVISGKGAGQLNIDGSRVYATVHVILKSQGGTTKAEGSFTRTNSNANWTVTLDKAAEAGDTVVAYNQIGDTKSDEASVEVKELLADQYKDKLTMPTGEIWIEQYVANTVNDDEKAEAIDLLKKQIQL